MMFSFLLEIYTYLIHPCGGGWDVVKCVYSVSFRKTKKEGGEG